ncbi:MAG: type II secretion system protein [Rickettsiales bacterium]
MKSRSAFSLVELSIVLVILGLLTGGILAGQSLIRAAELRSVASEYSRYVAATQTFRDKYFAIPGDMRNATAFWGDDNTNCPDAAVANGIPGTCNGNGDGILAAASANGATGEIFQFWKHLALAGLIEGNYTGISGSGSTIDMTVGINIPKSKLSSGSWGVRESFGSFYPGFAGDVFAGSFGNMMQMGKSSSPTDNGGLVLKPEEAWNIDTKLDDGKPATGKVITRAYPTCTNATGVTDYASTYLLTSSSVGCALFFPNAF